MRWIEFAAASPILNCIVCYYVEGDRGHLLDERALQRKDAINVRGNAYSFSMPWETIAAKLKDVVDGNVEWSVIPQDENVLAKTVLFNLRIGNVFCRFVLPSKLGLPIKIFTLIMKSLGVPGDSRPPSPSLLTIHVCGS